MLNMYAPNTDLLQRNFWQKNFKTRIILKELKSNLNSRPFTAYIHIRGVIKRQLLFSIFSKSIYLFINNYLVPFKVASYRYKTLMATFFKILETLLKCDLWYRQQLLFILLSPISQENAFLSSVSSVLGRGKRQRGPSLGTTVVEG